MKDHSRLLHISDLHLGDHFLPTVGKALRKFAEQSNLDVIVASGDFTQDATENEFQLAKQYLDSLPDVPTIVTPGNHDVPPRWQFRDLFQPFRLYKQYIHPKLNYHVEVGPFLVVSLNSTTCFGSLLNGRLTQRQLDYCSKVFANTSSDLYRVVVLHHQLVPAPSLKREVVAGNAKEAISQLSAHQVDLILGGHKHRSYVGHSLDFYKDHGGEHGIVLVQSGTTTSRRGRGREREKNSFNVIETTPDNIEVTQYIYFPELDEFRVFGLHAFPGKWI